MIKLVNSGGGWGGEADVVLCKSVYIEDVISALLDKARDSYGSVSMGTGDYVIKLAGSDETLTIDAGYEFKTGLLDSDEKVIKHVRNWYQSIKR